MKKLGTIINKEMIGKIQIIDRLTFKWITLKHCLDTPNSINKAIKELTKQGYTNLWFVNCGNRKPLF